MGNKAPARRRDAMRLQPSPPGFRWSTSHPTRRAKPTLQRRRQDTGQRRGFWSRGASNFFPLPSLRFPFLARVGTGRRGPLRHVTRARGVSGRMAWAAVVAVLLACLPHLAAASSPYRAAAALRRLETVVPMDTAQGMREKADVAKVAAEDVSTTGFGAESEREVPTGPDPIHHHGRGPRRESP
ncbi:unnamed protein product [Urochloa decumbens]|uniref:Uncharacterized protein n=1 Tax=Urochloa decumbens TaxID=240449 RepID=A0ABC9C965_9POAL